MCAGSYEEAIIMFANQKFIVGKLFLALLPPTPAEIRPPLLVCSGEVNW